jgi:uncharacterized protein (TIGR02391 family)
MDTEKMRARLERFLDLCERYDTHQREIGYQFDEQARALNDEIVTEVPTVKAIVTKVDPTLADEITPPSNLGGATGATSATRQALGIIRDKDELAAMLAPDAPSLVADRMHHWVWAAAASFWEAGQHAVAVEQGAKSLTAFIQQESGSHSADREMAADVFSPKPAAGRLRLWLTGDRDTDTWRSRQDGLHLLAMGAYAGIRNVAAHAVEPGWSEQEALEYLAVLSVVARWADETEAVWS